MRLINSNFLYPIKAEKTLNSSKNIKIKSRKRKGSKKKSTILNC